MVAIGTTLTLVNVVILMDALMVRVMDYALLHALRLDAINSLLQMSAVHVVLKQCKQT